MKYIAFLRGINVSGKNKIKMAELRQYLAELDILNIQTYIQSGNIIFESSEVNINILEQDITDKIKEKFGFDVPTLVLTIEQLQKVVDNHPFAKDLENDKKFISVTFLAKTATPENIEMLLALNYPNEFIELQGQVIYGFFPKGFGRAKLTNTRMERVLKVACTTRNWRTCNKVLEIAN